MTSGFTLPESHAAYLDWCAATGLDSSSAAWAEVWEVLKQAGLLEADRCPQRSLFEQDRPLGDTREVRKLRLAVVGGLGIRVRPRRPCDTWGELDSATGAAVVIALVDRHYGGLLDMPHHYAVPWMRSEIAGRVVGVFDRPSEALGMLLSAEMGNQDNGFPVVSGSLLAQVVYTAVRDDRFAEEVFSALLAHPRHRLSLMSLCQGKSLVFDSTVSLDDSSPTFGNAR